MAGKTKDNPDFFEENPFDAVKAATGSRHKDRQGRTVKSTGAEKRKAGFYLSTQLLDRFNRKFYELKLEDVSIENKSALLEIALTFALDDIDRGKQSRVLQSLE